MEKRVVFRSAWLPYALLAPQIAITIVFFFWPAAQAIWFSFLLQDAFGLKTEFIGLQNFIDLFRDSHYLASFRVTAVFSVLVAAFGIAISLVLATMADRVVRGALAYKTLLIWPYAVAPAVAGVLWAFLFAPSIGILTYVLKRWGIDWNWIILDGDQAMLLVVIAVGVEPDQLQLPVLPRRACNRFPSRCSRRPRSTARGRRAASGRSSFRCSRPRRSSCWWSTSSTRSSSTFGVIDATTQGGPAGATQILVYKVYHDGIKSGDLGGSSAQSVVLMVIVIALTVVQFRFIEKKVQY